MTSFFSDQDLKPIHSSQRALVRREEEEMRFRKVCANLLLKGGMSRDICRGILQRGLLFLDEDQQACAILEQQICILYDEVDDIKAYQEPLSPECIHFMFRLIDHPIPSKLDGLLDRMIINRYQLEENVLSDLRLTNEKRIAKRVKERAELQHLLQAHYPFALLALLSVAAGIVILFVGFHEWTYPEIVLGLVLLSPVFILRESNQRVVQLRQDVAIEHRITELNNQIALLQQQTQQQQQKMARLQNQLRTTPRLKEHTAR